MKFDVVNEIVGELGTLKFYPSDPTSRLAVVKLVGNIATTEEQVRWLVARMLVLYDEWPGPRELRACFCSRYKPKDGIETKSTIYTTGIPSEKKSEPMKALPSGATVSADRQLENAVRLLARSKSLDRPRRFAAPRVPDVPTNAAYRPVTAADVARAEAEHRTKRRERENAAARKEAGL